MEESCTIPVTVIAATTPDENEMMDDEPDNMTDPDADADADEDEDADEADTHTGYYGH